MMTNLAILGATGGLPAADVVFASAAGVSAALALVGFAGALGVAVATKLDVRRARAQRAAAESPEPCGETLRPAA